MPTLIAIPTAPIFDYAQHEKRWQVTDWEKANRKFESPEGRINGVNPRIDAVRETWWKHIPEPDVVGRFFIGNSLESIKDSVFDSPDTIRLNCADGYRNLIDKIRGICQWALDNGFDQMLKVDDDSFIHAGMFDFLKRNTDEVVTHVWDFSNGLFALSGGPGYVLRKTAMQAVIDTPRTAFPHCNEMEDHWVSEVVRAAGIKPVNNIGFIEEINISPAYRYSFHPVNPKGMRDAYQYYYVEGRKN